MLRNKPKSWDQTLEDFMIAPLVPKSFKFAEEAIKQMQVNANGSQITNKNQSLNSLPKSLLKLNFCFLFN